MWINRLYFNISNFSNCPTTDTRDVNELGLVKFRTQADNNSQQICYYNRNKRDKTFSSFLAIRKQTPTDDKIFSIEKIIDDTTKNNTIYTDIGDELNNFSNDNVQFEQPVREISESDSRREEKDGSKRQFSDYDRRISKLSGFALK